MKKATIDDVARLANVSIKTVSRVLNHEARVRDATRKSVLAAMETLKYRPNSSARRLAGKRSYLLGLLYDNPSSSYVSAIQNGVLSACKDHHYDLLIQPCRHDDPGLLDDISELVNSNRVDGLLLTAPVSDMRSVEDLLSGLNAPNVVISQAEDGGSEWAVGTNDRDISAAMVQHLASLGHRHIAFILGHPDHLAIASRFEGYKDGMKACGLKVRTAFCVQGYNSFDSGVACARGLLNRKQRPTAIFCANDDMAIGVMRVAQEMNLSIPGDLSVAGFDDQPMATQIWPLLTTIRQPASEMAALATQLLVKRLRGGSPQGIQRTLLSELVIRDSTGPAPGSIQSAGF